MGEVNAVKNIFTLTKNEVMFLIIGAVIVIVIIKRVIPYFKKFMEMREKFYKEINGKFDKLQEDIELIKSGSNITFEILINNIIDEYTDKKSKTHFADEKFVRLMKKYKLFGDGNAESMQKQWDSIPFEN